MAQQTLNELYEIIKKSQGTAKGRFLYELFIRQRAR